MMMHGFGFGSWGTFGWIGMILNLVIALGVIIGIIWLVVWLVKRVPTQEQGPVAPMNSGGGFQSPREILQSRYALGEITREQYVRMKQDLE